VIAGLRRVFPGDKVAINPMRKDNGRELADALILAVSHVLVVQAKDSPNTEESLGRSLDRKRLVSRQQVEKGVRQTKGAVAYIRSHDSLDLLVGRRDLQVTIGNRALFPIVVIKEMFADEGELYVATCREMESYGVQGVVLDYPNLDLFAHRLRAESAFISALEEYRSLILKDGIFVNPQSFLVNRFAAWLS
jgi:hypothetical protein